MYTAAVITVSDRAYEGIYEDQAGPVVRDLLKDAGYDVVKEVIIPDEKNKIIETLLRFSEGQIALIVTAGGTGFSKRDLTPEATKEVIERATPGISEYMRMRSSEITPRAILSRGISGIRDNTLILNLPGSPKAAKENLSFVLPALEHGLDMLYGKKE